MDNPESSPSSTQNIVLQSIKPLFPIWLWFIIGVALGLGWGYVISPVVWTDAAPVHLEGSYKSEWLKLIADQLELTGDAAHAKLLLARAGSEAEELLNQLVQENPDDPGLARLQALYTEEVRAEAQAIQSQVEGRQGPSIVLLVILVVIIIVVWGLWAAFGQMVIMILRNSVPLLLSRGKSTAERKGPTAEQRTAGLKVAREAAETMSTDYTESEQGPPLVQYMSTYLIGDDLYDDSFSVETPEGDFLGETGAGISETIGVGEPKKVTAVEAWLFDKNDIRTVTKVLMSEYAYNDETLRAKLAPKGEAILIEPESVVMLETNTLRVQARIVDLAYGPEGPLPPNSYFERLTIELAAWPIEGADLDGPPPVPPIPDAFGDTTGFE